MGGLGEQEACPKQSTSPGQKKTKMAASAHFYLYF